MATCEWCNSEFKVKSGCEGRFCSANCWYSFARARPGKTCPVCQKEFRGSVSETCSRSCGYEMRKRKNPFRGRLCPQCGGPILNPYPKATDKFCSTRCSMLSRNKHGGRVRPDGYEYENSGYVQIKINGNWILKHRWVMEQVLGRKLEAHERVHHKDGNRLNNDPSNLELWKVRKKDPAGVRASDYHCVGCNCMTRQHVSVHAVEGRVILAWDTLVRHVQLEYSDAFRLAKMLVNAGRLAEQQAAEYVDHGTPSRSPLPARFSLSGAKVSIDWGALVQTMSVSAADSYAFANALVIKGEQAQRRELGLVGMDPRDLTILEEAIVGEPSLIMHQRGGLPHG